MRIRVGTEHPSRRAQARWDSRRRTRAMAKFSPKVFSACAAAGGRVERACGLLGTQRVYQKCDFEKVYFIYLPEATFSENR